MMMVRNDLIISEFSGRGEELINHLRSVGGEDGPA